MDQSTRLIEIQYLQSASFMAGYKTIAILAFDRQADSLEIRVTARWDEFGDTDLGAVLTFTEELSTLAQEGGADLLLRHISSKVPKTLRVTDPEFLFTDDLPAELDRIEARTRPEKGDKHGSLAQAGTVSQASMIPSARDYACATAGLISTVAALLLSYAQVRTTPTTGSGKQLITLSTIAKIDLPRKTIEPPSLPKLQPAVQRHNLKRRKSTTRPGSVQRTFTPPAEAIPPGPVVEMYDAGDLHVASVEGDQPVLIGSQDELPGSPQPSGVRRVLHAFLYPFRKLGQAVIDVAVTGR